MRRLATLVIFLALVPTSRALAGTNLIVGVDDDSLKWYKQTSTLTAVYRDLGLQAVRVTLDWQPGERGLSRTDRTAMNRVAGAAWGIRVVLAVTGPADDPPAEEPERSDYCSFVAGVLSAYPQINDVVIWTEPNSPRFWSHPDAAAYEALLARCWDVLHSYRARVNVISSAAPHHDPASWYRKLGKALRASGRTQRILDTVGHNAYPETSAEPPSTKHKGAAIDEGDYGRLMHVLTAGFKGTAQPVPGRDGVTIWYLEDGFQTAVPDLPVYTGTETDRHVVTPDEQGAQLAAALRLAYCQKNVGAFFNFQLRDETRLAGWQSGLLYANWTLKPSFEAFRSAVGGVNRHAVACPSEPVR